MAIEWDSRKAASNSRKHGIDFADAATVLYDPLAATIRDETRDDERFVTLGVDALGRVLVVVYSWRGDTARLISARKATPAEPARAESTRQAHEATTRLQQGQARTGAHGTAGQDSDHHPAG